MSHIIDIWVCKKVCDDLCYSKAITIKALTHVNIITYNQLYIFKGKIILIGLSIVGLNNVYSLSENIRKSRT